MMPKATLLAVAALVSFAFGGVAVGQSAAPTPAASPKAPKSAKADKPKDETKKSGPKKTEPLFSSSDVINLTIKAPISTFTKGSTVPDVTIPGTLTVAGSPDVLAINLAPRGVKRRTREVCPFPPLWVEFTAKPPEGSVFKGQKKLKLVGHCRPQEGFQQYVLLEYAAYRLYKVLSPISFGVRLVKIDYVDETGRPVTSRLGFFIEDTGEVAKRNQLAEVKGVPRIMPSQLSPRDAVRFAMFQNMIGNLDWAMTAGPPGSDCCHNSRLLGAKAATTAFVPTPYDFDYAGLVDSPYAVPPTKIKVASVRVRRYRGYCIHNPEIAGVAAEFNAKRPQLLATIDEITPMEDGTRSKARRYIESFFEQTASPATIAEKFEQACL